MTETECKHGSSMMERNFLLFPTTHGPAGEVFVISWESKPVRVPVPQPGMVPRPQGRVVRGRGTPTAGSREAVPGGGAVLTTFFHLTSPPPPHVTTPPLPSPPPSHTPWSPCSHHDYDSHSWLSFPSFPSTSSIRQPSFDLPPPSLPPPCSRGRGGVGSQERTRRRPPNCFRNL